MKKLFLVLIAFIMGAFWATAASARSPIAAMARDYVEVDYALCLERPHLFAADSGGTDSGLKSSCTRAIQEKYVRLSRSVWTIDSDTGFIRVITRHGY